MSPSRRENSFTFIDLFAGIGGFRLAAESLGGGCVFSSEFNRDSQDTYERNFGERPLGDITKIPSLCIPEHDILLGGFPCQPFSITGKRKGFSDTRGNLIYEIFRIVRDIRPKAFLLENVPGLLTHDSGRTFSVILSLFGKTSETGGGFNLLQYKDSLGYFLRWKILNSFDFGLAQRRKRIFIAGFKDDIESFQFPVGGKGEGYQTVTFKDIMDINSPKWLGKEDLARIMQYFLKKTSSSQRFIGLKDIAPTLTGQYGSPGEFNTAYFAESEYGTLLMDFQKKSFNLISPLCRSIMSGNIKSRLFTPRECARLQGFPESYALNQNGIITYKQLGNSVSIPVIKAILANMLNCL